MYKTRGKSLKNAAEEEMWKEINWEYMSEESELDADSDVIVKHPISFRSDRNKCYVIYVITLFVMHIPSGLNKLIKKCDKRTSAKKATKHGFRKKERVEGSVSVQEVPDNAPL